MRDEAVAAVKRREIFFQPASNVVCVEDGELRRFGQAVRAHHGDIHPGNRQNTRAAPRRGGNGADGIFAAQVHDRMAGQKFDEMFRHANRSDTRAAAAVRNAKGLVQIQMADVRADVRRPAQPDLRVQVRTVHVNLSAVGVNDFADVLDGFLKHTVRGRIGDHQARQILLVRLRFGAEVRHVNVAVLVARDGDDFQPGHDGAGGVGSVRGGRNQTDVAMAFAPAFVPGADDEQAGVFALGAGIRLQRNARKAGDFRKPVFELLKERLIAASLFQRRERMNFRKLRPGNGKHFRRGIQFHGAGTQRDHGRGERKVARFEPLEITQHFGLAVIRIEDLVGEKRGGP